MKLLEIDRLYIISNPNKNLFKYKFSVEELIQNKSIFYELELNEENVLNIINTICDYVLDNKRNKKSDAKKLLYILIKYSKIRIKNDMVIDKLFEIYKRYVNNKTNDVWKLSLVLKDNRLVRQPSLNT